MQANCSIVFTYTRTYFSSIFLVYATITLLSFLLLYNE